MPLDQIDSLSENSLHIVSSKIDAQKCNNIIFQVLGITYFFRINEVLGVATTTLMKSPDVKMQFTKGNELFGKNQYIGYPIIDFLSISDLRYIRKA